MAPLGMPAAVMVHILREVLFDTGGIELSYSAGVELG